MNSVILNEKEDELYFRFNGKYVQITAVFTSDTMANEYLHENKEEAVIYQAGDFVFTANKNDLGV